MTNRPHRKVIFMRSPLIQRQSIAYLENESFALHKVIKSGVNHTYQKNSHWHDDLEIVYLLHGKAKLFIEGDCICAEAGQLVVVNYESVHRLVVETEAISDPSVIAALDLMIPRKFLDEQFPEYKTVRFKNEAVWAGPEIQKILHTFLKYRHSSARPYDRLYMHGLLLQLLYYLCEGGAVCGINDQTRRENPTRLKKILNYIDEHYHEPMSQAEIAARFYFTPQYFSRFFKQSTGMTFSEHLTGRRIHGARQELLHTDKLITEIAFNNGFSDERSFINAFKKMYQVTPHQYRKTIVK